MGTVVGSGKTVPGRVDSVEEDSEADSHDKRLPRFPQRLTDAVGVSGVEEE